MKLCSRKMASGRPKMVCDNQIDQNDKFRPNLTYTVFSGISATWIGTTCITNTATNSRFLNGKSIQANAYAASSANVIGMNTAGRVMTIEFRMNCDSGVDPLPVQASV